MKRWILLFVIVCIFLTTACEIVSEDQTFYDVSFLDGYGEVISSTRAKQGSPIVFPEIPTMEGHRFIGFDTDESVVTKDLVISSLFEKNIYLIRFVTMSDDDIAPLAVPFDTAIPSLPEPSKEGFVFSGWRLSPDDETPFSDEMMPAHNLLLYASWARSVHMVYFETFTELLVDPLALSYGDALPRIDLSREGYRLEGWYLDENCLERLNHQKMPDGDLTLYAKWEPNLYVLRYVTGLDQTIPSQGIRYGENVPIEDVLEVPGYQFLGWFLDVAFQTPYAGNTMPASDLTLYAKWLKEESVFIRAEGDQLYLADEIFRFSSFNVPNLHIIEDPNWHMADPFEQEDAIQSVSLMGGNVIRTYTFSVVGGIRPLEAGNTLAHIKGIGQYDEALFQSFDKILELAHKHGVYIIIPFIDEWQWVGGVAEFSALYGKTKSAFFTNATVKQGFKDFISYVLNRVNTCTGVAYKDDPMILAWELGNELRSATNPWIAEMASYVKSIDQNHLLLSGRDQVTTSDLDNPNIDIINSHYYTNNGTGTFAQRAKADRLLTKGEKPFIIGEYGLVSYDDIEEMLQEAYVNGTSGTLIWSLRFRKVNGGYYYHNDGPTRSYHYPGFSINNDYHEQAIIDLLTVYGHLMRQKAITAPPVPKAPVLFQSQVYELTWQGQTGSALFTIERRNSGTDLWVVMAEEIIDAYEYGPFYVDLSAIDGVSYDYRVRAFNGSGGSEYSNVVTISNQDS